MSNRSAIPTVRCRCRGIVAVVVCLFIFVGCRRESGRPHVVLVLIDTLRADYVGFSGARRQLTPSLDALAAESHVFTQAYATSSWTKSSIASLFTSQFPSAIGVRRREDVMPDSVITLAEVLRDAGGYSTFALTTNGYAGKDFGFAQGFESFRYPKLQRGYPDDLAQMYPAEGVSQEALAWLQQRDPARPFLMFLHYTDPHDAYLPHPGLLSDPEPPGRFDGSRRQLEIMDKTPSALLTQEEKERIKYLYAAEVKYCDRWIGALIDGLRTAGLWDDVLLVVTADHGEGLWDHGMRGHGFDLHDEVIRVPLLIRYPRAAGMAAARIEEPVSLIDVAPTILKAINVDLPAAFTGRDLRALVGRRLPADGASIFMELGLDGLDLEAIRTGSHLLVRDRRREATRETLGLFDLVADPGERVDTAAMQPDVVVELAGKLNRWRDAMTAAEPAPIKHASDLELATRESLRALGYLPEPE